MNQLQSETFPVFAGVNLSAGRFQVMVEYSPGVIVCNGSASTIEEAVELFMKQAPGCDVGEIALFDSSEGREIGSVKWKLESTENGLRVPHRRNIFYDWNTALVALELQRRTRSEALIELAP